MNVHTLEIDPEEALDKLNEYKKSLHKNATAEGRACVAAYRQMAKGKRLIDLSVAIPSGGFDHKGLPRVAIVRADMKQVLFRRNYNGKHSHIMVSTKFGVRHPNASTLRSNTLTFSYRGECGEFPREDFYHSSPTMPPSVVEKITTKLEKYHILFEATDWKAIPIARVPVDPYLLRHVFGTLYSVEAEWETTEVERAVASAIRLGMDDGN